MIEKHLSVLWRLNFHNQSHGSKPKSLLWSSGIPPYLSPLLLFIECLLLSIYWHKNKEMGDIVVEAPRVVLGTQKHTNITTMGKAMMEVVGSFCESPEETPLSCCGVEASEKGRAKEGFPLRSFAIQVLREIR